MSAYEQFTSEKRSVDSLLADGYVIVATWEDLDGMRVRFAKAETEGGDPGVVLELPVLTAEARKYVSHLVFTALSSASSAVG